MIKLMKTCPKINISVEGTYRKSSNISLTPKQKPLSNNSPVCEIASTSNIPPHIKTYSLIFLHELVRKG